MQAFFVHDEKKQSDMMVIPESDYIVPVNKEVMAAFISVKPDFSVYVGQPLNGLPPETLGRIIATRASEGDVCIVSSDLWQQRMALHLG